MRLMCEIFLELISFFPCRRSCKKGGLLCIIACFFSLNDVFLGSGVRRSRGLQECAGRGGLSAARTGNPGYCQLPASHGQHFRYVVVITVLALNP